MRSAKRVSRGEHKRREEDRDAVTCIVIGLRETRRREMKTLRDRRDERCALDAARSSHNDVVPLSVRSSARRQDLPFDSRLLVNCSHSPLNKVLSHEKISSAKCLL